MEAAEKVLTTTRRDPAVITEVTSLGDALERATSKDRHTRTSGQCRLIELWKENQLSVGEQSAVVNAFLKAQHEHHLTVDIKAQLSTVADLQGRIAASAD